VGGGGRAVVVAAGCSADGGAAVAARVGRAAPDEPAVSSRGGGGAHQHVIGWSDLLLLHSMQSEVLVPLAKRPSDLHAEGRGCFDACPRTAAVHVEPATASSLIPYLQ
jgi:hypothetical protein